MLKKFSALDSNYKIIKKETNDNLGLIFRKKNNLQLMQVAAWPNTIEKIGLDVANYLNLPTVAEPNKVIGTEKVAMMRIEPLKWWVLGSDLPLLSTEEGTTLDLSHSFTVLELSGKSTNIFLNRFLPLDLRKKSLPENTVASSAIHHVSVKLWRSHEGYNLFIPRGFALSLWEIFLESASQFGYEIK